MNKTIDWINKIIEDLINPEIKLKDTLLKVQVLSFKIKNEKLKGWVNKELNGYIGEEVPGYRIIPSIVFGNLIQDTGFGGYRWKQNHPLPDEYLETDIRNALMTVKMQNSISELEHMIEEKSDYQINVPYILHKEFSKFLSNGWVVDSACQRISLTNIEGIINSVKSNLLNYLLELADEIGENENIDIMKEKIKMDNLFDKTIGKISGNIVNISFAPDNQQFSNTGDDAKFNVAKGNKNTQNINIEALKELSNFISELKPLIDSLPLLNEDEVDIKTEIARIETQVIRQKPKYPIINEALKVINGILIEVAANAIAPPILEKLGMLITQFSS